MNPYDHISTETYWQKKWEEDFVYRTDTHSNKKTFYGLVEFPYPSGAGLHVGHVRSYTGMDVIVRKRRMEGFETLFPIGWDAFGLPAENYAIKTGIHPSVTTNENIDTFRRQLKSCGFSFDWEREIYTTDPEYYKWTQWIFLQMYKKGLAYKREMPVNWCPKDKCVLANEEVLDGTCERCGTVTEKRNKEQWMLAITKYAERLDKDLDNTTYLERIKIQQRNWIGMSEGSEITFMIKAGDTMIPYSIFTTRADTLFGCTYSVLAPDHALVNRLLSEGSIINKEEVEAYVKEAVNKPDMDRSAEGKEKTGVRLEGIVAINPVNKKEIPVFIADYVLASYGTGAIMAVPAHDERDYEFAQKYGIPVVSVIAPETGVPQENPEYRKSIVAVLWDKKRDIFLTLDWKDKGGNLFIGGGVEGDEDLVACAKREIQEETGYSSLSLLAKSGTIYHNYFAHSKNVARRIEATGVLFELQGDEQTSTALTEDEKNAFTPVWLSKKEIQSKITDELHSYVFKHLVEGELFTDDGILVNSDTYSGLTSRDARIKITEDISGTLVKKSKLRDWVFARQRYWGEPIPLVYDKDGVMYPVAESELPVVLPMVDKYEPTDNGESPLAVIDTWVNVRGKINEDGYFISDENGEVFRRETDTMPQWAGSSWYFMRYIDPKNSAAISEKEMLMKWLPVTWYNGGMEHTTLHLLYSRFWYKFLFDIGLTPTSEPYTKRTSQGMILGIGGVKMSKSLGNVVNPDDIVKKFGADTLRMYEMFIGPFDQAVAWDDKSVIGIRRFVDKVYALKAKAVAKEETLSITHKTIKKVGEDIETMSFNTAISALMICLNTYEKEEGFSTTDFKLFLQVLSPFAPFIAEELWKDLGENGSIHQSAWPLYDQSKLVESEVTMSVQVNGKLRGTFVVPFNSEESVVLEAAKNTDGYKKYVENAEPKKVIVITNRLVNIVI